MFIGHFALGLGAKRVAPAASLGTLFLACQLADLIWPNLVLLGVEQVVVSPGITAVTPLDFQSYPYSHSLVMLGVWAMVFVGIYERVRRSTTTGVLAVIAGLVLSHWVLDVVAHRPDMPLVPGDPVTFGFGLWNSKPATIIVESAMLLAGLVLYVRATKARDKIGSIGFWGLIIFLIAVNMASMFGPPPPSATAVAWTAQAMWIIVLWGYWVDRHRA